MKLLLIPFKIIWWIIKMVVIVPVWIILKILSCFSVTNSSGQSRNLAGIVVVWGAIGLGVLILYCLSYFCGFGWAKISQWFNGDGSSTSAEVSK